ncbi:toxic anion resistance protein [Paenibacillus sp. N3.4]|uniref:toxic anion resistance protein n=1 Tax=Paenibacillus sp. N3.4 TaxID=2603222 RepID=UPI0011C80D2D|nr:toxic anion resistance protein [Paenibacillus sp. N3.4]TXK68941.1 tellurium resistance protein [Paenibacillus sp. N3.4]
MSKMSIQLKPEDQQKAEQEANQIALKVRTTDPFQFDDTLEQLGKINLVAEQNAGQSLKMLERPVNDLIVGKGKEVSISLLKLRGEVDALNNSRNTGFFGRLIKKNPLSGYVHKYQSVKTNVNEIVKSLRAGRETLEENTATMRNLKKDAIQHIYALQFGIQRGTLLQNMLEQELAKPENESKKQFFEKGIRKVVGRVKDNHEMILLLNQAIAATDIIVDNNDKLMDAVASSINKTTSLITVSAMIALALNDQGNVIKAVEATDSLIEDQFLRNAALLKETTEKSAQLLEKPSMSIEAINQALSDTYAALDISEQSNRRIIDGVKDFIGKLEPINQALSNRLAIQSNANPALDDASNKELISLMK